MNNTLTNEELDRSIRIQPTDQRGDLSFEPFTLEREMGYPAGELAKDLAVWIPDFGEDFSEVKPAGGFLNFYLNRERLIQRTLQEILETEDQYGSNNLGEGKKVVLDYSAPNIGKPLHVGHIRSTILGDSLVKLLKFSGYDTYGINYLGDVGLHIGKILSAYKKEGSLERLQNNPEGELLNLYVSFCKREEKDDSLTDLAKSEVRLVEEKDPATLQILETISRFSLIAFDRAYQMLNVSFDETTGQSNFSEKGKDIVHKALEKGIAKKTDDGALSIELKNFDLPAKIVLRSDGTAIYSTQDIGAAVSRYEQHHFDRMLYIVGDAQALYFKQLFTSLEVMGYPWARQCEHVGFGLINLEDGKMATREGKVVYLEELLLKAVAKSREIIEKKNPQIKDKEEVSRIVGIGAIKYQILTIDPIKEIGFSWSSALNFDGRSAPSIQYSYVRANSILEKSGSSEKKEYSFRVQDLSNKEEYVLIRKMALFPKVVETAVKSLKPSFIANYAYDLSGQFNRMYSSVRMLDSPDQLESKMAMVKSYQTVIRNSMKLLGIELPIEM